MTSAHSPLSSNHPLDLPLSQNIHLDLKLQKIDSELLKLRVQRIALKVLNMSISVISIGLSIANFFPFNIPQFLWNRKFQILKGGALPVMALGYLNWHEVYRNARFVKLEDRRKTILLLYEQRQLNPYKPQKKFLGLSWPLATPEKLEITKRAYGDAKQQQINRLGEETLTQLKERLNNPKPSPGKDAIAELEQYEERAKEVRDYLFSGVLPYLLEYAKAQGVQTGRVSSNIKIVQIVPAQWSESVEENLETEEACKLSWVNYGESGFLDSTNSKPLILMKGQNGHDSISVKQFFKIVLENQDARNFPKEFWDFLLRQATNVPEDVPWMRLM